MWDALESVEDDESDESDEDDKSDYRKSTSKGDDGSEEEDSGEDSGEDSEADVEQVMPDKDKHGSSTHRAATETNGRRFRSWRMLRGIPLRMGHFAATAALVHGAAQPTDWSI